MADKASKAVQDDDVEYVAVAVPVPVPADYDAKHAATAAPAAATVEDELVFNELPPTKLSVSSPIDLPPSAPSPITGEFNEAKSPSSKTANVFHGGATAEELRGDPPRWLLAFAAMLVYHLCSFVLAVASVTLSFMTLLPAILLLPLCCFGLVIFRVHVLLVESLLHVEVLLHNWTLSMINRRDLLLGVPPTDFVLFPKQTGIKTQLQQMFSRKTLGKTVYFLIVKFPLMCVHIFAAVWTPLSTLASRTMGGYGFCPVAYVLTKLTRYVAHRCG